MAATKDIPLNQMLDIPAMAAPPGVSHNFVNPPDMNTEYYIALILSLTISLLVVCMRNVDKSSIDPKIWKRRL